MTISVPSEWNFSHRSFDSKVTFGSSSIPSSSGSNGGLTVDGDVPAEGFPDAAAAAAAAAAAIWCDASTSSAVMKGDEFDDSTEACGPLPDGDDRLDGIFPKNPAEAAAIGPKAARAERYADWGWLAAAAAAAAAADR